MLHRLSIKKAYWFAFGILAVWATFAFVTMFTLIESQEKFGKLINLSGKQRMLSQKTAYFSHLAYHNDTSKLGELKALISDMKKDHAFITGNLPSKSLNVYYHGPDGLSRQVENYFTHLDAFVHAPTEANLRNIANSSQPLLVRLHHAVSIFESENETIVRQLQSREFFIYLGTILTLVLEAFFIIRPMIVSHQHYLAKLEDEVNRQTKEVQIFARIFENAREGMVITDEDETILNVNTAFSTITGYTKEEALGQTPRVLKSGRHDPLFYEEMWRDLDENNLWSGEIINKRKNGQEVYEQLTIMKLLHNGTVHYVSVFTDITERIHHMRELDHLASHDTLTGLLNRNAILSRLDHAIILANRTQKLLALLFIDLDNFKVINDSMGHAIGDRLLQEFSKRFYHAIRKSDTLGRLGGDEFIILLEALDDKGDEKVVLQKLIKALEQPFIYNNHELFVSASIGITYYPDDSADEEISAQNLVRKADLAMYKAKELGKNQAAYYNDDLANIMTSKLMTENLLRDAIGNQELELYLQPKIDIKSGKVNGAEALLRWHREGEMISPATFIPIAEETNLIKKIDLWVVHEAIKKVTKIHETGHTDFTLAFNLSGRSFSDKQIIDTILDAIYKSGKAESLVIEITEGVLVENLLFASTTLKKIKSLGVSVALDDFGTGYSSFSYLSQMPFDTIKIDRSFISNLDKAKQKILVEAIMWFSGQLGMNIVAEGVETEEQFNWLKEKNCEYAQGYLFGRPQPYSEFQKLL